MPKSSAMMPPASSGRVLSIRTGDESGLDSLERAERAQDEADISKLEQRQASARAADKIGTVVGYGPYDTDQSPTQVFGMAAIKAPDWRFSRWYFRDKMIVDLFRTKQAYSEANVEARRRLAKKYHVKYAALGPSMSYRTDLPQQLGL
jgi:uncharacterized membrane protein